MSVVWKAQQINGDMNSDRRPYKPCSAPALLYSTPRGGALISAIKAYAKLTGFSTKGDQVLLQWIYQESIWSNSNPPMIGLNTANIYKIPIYKQRRVCDRTYNFISHRFVFSRNSLVTKRFRVPYKRTNAPSFTQWSQMDASIRLKLFGTTVPEKHPCHFFYARWMIEVPI